MVVAGIGVAGTLTAGIADGLVAQRWARQREEKAWARERAPERERWAREDEARTFELRREVFEEFDQAVKLTRMFDPQSCPQNSYLFDAVARECALPLLIDALCGLEGKAQTFVSKDGLRLRSWLA